MWIITVIFWILAALVLYTYAFYPMLLAVAARLKGASAKATGNLPKSVSVVIAAKNEEHRIAAKTREMLEQIAHAGVQGEVIIVSDGSTDATAAAARAAGARVIEMPASAGKAVALSTGCATSTADLLVFADVRQRWHPDAMARLLENYADPKIGAVSGDLVIESSNGALAGVGLYWRYEKMVRKLESRVGSAVGVTGAICSVRRTLFHGIKPGIILDDVYWPSRVALGGHRVIHDQRAIAYDRLPEKSGDEFRRKVRTLSGNFQLVAKLPALLRPWSNPIWLQFISHKLCRLAVPWALLALLTLSAILGGPLYLSLLAAQILFYGIGLIGLAQGERCRIRLASAASSFMLLNIAAWIAFWTFITGRSGKSWSKVHYKTPPTAPPNPASEPISEVPVAN